MWWPRSAAELRAAFDAGDLSERQHLDLKRELPAKGKGLSLAVDVCAMTPDGGVIIYGVEEEGGAATQLCPLPLAGQQDRVHRIVRSSISEPPDITVLTFPDGDDESDGYVVVVVPPSARAPHMVSIRGDQRFYGRNGTENVPLTEGEVARLYRRREELAGTSSALSRLNDVAGQPAFGDLAGHGALFLSIAPALLGDELLPRARERLAVPGTEDYPAIIRKTISDSDPADRFKEWFPNLSSLGAWRDTARGLAAITDGELDLQRVEPRRALRVEVTYEGEVRLWFGGAVQPIRDDRVVQESRIGGLVAQSIAVASGFQGAAGYFGPVDIGILVNGLEGAVSEAFGPVHWDAPAYDAPFYQRIERVSALTIAQDPYAVAARVLDPLLRSTMSRQHEGFFNKYMP